MEKIKLGLIGIFACISLSLSAQNKKAESCYLEANKQYHEYGNKEKALGLLNKAIKKYPNYEKPYAFKAYIHERDKEYDKAKEAYITYLKLDSTHQTTYFYFAKMLMDSGDPKMAASVIEKFYTVPKMAGFNPKKDRASDKTLKKLKSLEIALTLAEEETQTIDELNLKNLGPNINTSSREYWPGMTMDKSLFIFTKVDLNQKYKQEDFYYSPVIDGKFGPSKLLPGKIRTLDNEGTVAIHPDGSTIYFTVCNEPDGFGRCDIYFSSTDGINWSPKQNMGSIINSASWDAQPTISMGGNALIFSSNRAGGYGGSDLYISYKNTTGQWSKPKNLGPTINTSMDEQAPFFHYDGETLYFSSDGHPGFGKMDLFVSRLNDVDEWTQPKNVSQYINTSGNEVGFYVEPDGKLAYFVSDRKGGYGNMDIWSFNLKEELRPAPANILSINIIDSKTKKPVVAKLILNNLKNNRNILDSTVSSVKTYYPSGGNYGLFSQAEGYLPFTQNYNKPINQSEGSVEQITVELIPARQGNSIVLKNIFFDFDQWEIKPESEKALKTLIKFLKSNPKLTIEIGGYTDNKGSLEYNKTLSNNRAKSVYTYLVKKGIDQTRLSSNGYGSLSTDDNSTEEKRAANRRIEIKIK